MKRSNVNKKSTDFFILFRRFIQEMNTGRKLKKDGKKIRSGTIDNFVTVYKLVKKFSEEKQFEMKFIPVTSRKNKSYEEAKKYWKEFYLQFTDYIYTECNCYDNYVGFVIRTLRTFFNHVSNELNMEIGQFHKSFYAPKEDIPIIVLSPEQINYLIYNTELNRTLPLHLHRIRDMFVFGCTVCLRVSDLLSIEPQHIVRESNACYLQLRSKKTNTFTSVKLPDYAIAIADKYRSKRKTVFPEISKGRFNIALKELGHHLNYNDPIIKYREKRGVKHIIYKDPVKRSHHTLADLITTHTMRRTGITTMLRLGMPDYLVRKVSGHAANSKEFYKYVHLAQNFLDEKTDEVFEKLKKIS